MKHIDNHNHRKLILPILPALPGMLLGASVLAQAETPQRVASAGSAAPSAAELSQPGGLEEVLVTARRREERAQDVPVAVSAINGSQLQELAITRFDELARATPALQVQSVNTGKNIPAYTIRSQRQSESVITQDPSVGVYFADVVQTRPHGVNVAMFDLASVQVLKGPQGTLFGRNTTGGAVVITPQAPTDTLEGYVSLGIGNYDQHSLEAMLNLPVSDSLQLRVSGQSSRRDGFVDNLYDGKKLNDEHTDSLRLSARFRPTDSIENNLVINGFSVDENGAANRPIGISPPLTLLTPFYPTVQADFDELNRRGRHTVNNDYPGKVDIDSVLVSNTTSWNIGSVTLKNIYGYRHLSAELRFDMDGLPMQIFHAFGDVREDQHSDEIQVLGTALDDRLDYIFGAYYFLEDGTERSGNTPLAPTPFGSIRDNGGKARNESWSLFAQASYRLPFLDSVSVTGGVRDNHDSREFTWSNYATRSSSPRTCALVDENGQTLNPCTRTAKKNFSEPTYTASIDWRITDDVLAYIAHRKGYRAGGFNLRANSPAQAVPFEPELVEDYELGFKTDWHVGALRGRFNVAAYHQDYSEIQRQQSILVNGVFAGSTIQNAADATIEGGEVELTVIPAEGLEVSLFYSYSDAQVEKWQALYPHPQTGAQTLYDISASSFAGAPKHSGGGSISWSLPINSAFGDVRVIGNIYSQSFTYVQDATLNPYTQQPYATSRNPSYTVANARVEWNEIMSSRFDAALYVRNLTDEDYYTGGVDLIAQNLGLNVRTIGEPRTWGAQLTYRF